MTLQRLQCEQLVPSVVFQDRLSRPECWFHASKDCENIQYASTLLRDGDHLLVAYGVEDCDSYVQQFLLSDILHSMVNVSDEIWHQICALLFSEWQEMPVDLFVTRFKGPHRCAEMLIWLIPIGFRHPLKPVPSHPSHPPANPFLSHLSGAPDPWSKKQRGADHCGGRRASGEASHRGASEKPLKPLTPSDTNTTPSNVTMSMPQCVNWEWGRHI